MQSSGKTLEIRLQAISETHDDGEVRVFFELNNQDRMVGYSSFDFTGTVDIEVIVSQPITSVRVRPTARGIEPRVEGQRITFTLDSPAKLSIEVNGGIDDNLFARQMSGQAFVTLLATLSAFMFRDRLLLVLHGIRQS